MTCCEICEGWTIGTCNQTAEWCECHEAQRSGAAAQEPPKETIWGDDFDAKFPNLYFIHSFGTEDFENATEPLKSFITTTIQREVEREREKFNEEVERVAQFAYERLCFADYPHCETVYADTRAAQEVTARIKKLASAKRPHIQR